MDDGKYCWIHTINLSSVSFSAVIFLTCRASKLPDWKSEVIRFTHLWTDLNSQTHTHNPASVLKCDVLVDQQDI